MTFDCLSQSPAGPPLRGTSKCGWAPRGSSGSILLGRFGFSLQCPPEIRQDSLQPVFSGRVQLAVSAHCAADHRGLWDTIPGLVGGAISALCTQCNRFAVQPFGAQGNATGPIFVLVQRYLNDWLS